MLKKHKGIFIILAILCSAVIFTVLSSKSVVEDNKIIKVPSTEVVRIAQNKISEQGYDGYYTEKIYPPILVTDRKTNQFLAEIFHGGEEYYTQFSFPYFTYKVTLKHPSLPNVEVSVDANDGKVTGWKFEENPVLDKYNNGTFAEENYLEAIGLLAVNGINSDNVLLEREEVDTETGKTKLVFKNHESVVESDFGSAFIFYEIEIKNGAVTEFSTKMSLPVAFSNYLDKNQQKSDDINGFWFWTNIFIFVIALIVLYKNRSSALHYRDKVLVFLGSVLFLVFLEAFNGLPSILHITNNGTLFGILFNYLISALSLVVALVLPGLVFYLAGSIIYEQVKKERFSMFKGSKNKNGDLLTCTIYGYIGAVIMGVLVLAASFLIIAVHCREIRWAILSILFHHLCHPFQYFLWLHWCRRYLKKLHLGCLLLFCCCKQQNHV